MDFRVLGLKGIVVGSDNGAPSPFQTRTNTFLSVESEPKHVGSGFTKQERFEDQWKNCKLPRTDDLSTLKTMPLLQGTPLLSSNTLVSTDACQRDHMINFSLFKSQVPSISKDGSVLETSKPNTDLSYYQHTPSMYTRNAGYGSGSLGACMHGIFPGVDGPFTPSQLNELKHQTLICKYIIADVIVPSNLLIPLKKSIYPYGFTSSSTGSWPHNSLGWDSFHMRYTGKVEAEPGRCRRTDGKKWRCSWDVIPNQKYCERHINRGRHRSRKPVVGQTISSSISASVKTSGGAANNLATPWQQQFKNLQFGAVNPSPDTLVDRVQDQRRLSAFSSTTDLKHQGSTFAESSVSDFEHVASDSLTNRSHRSYCMNSKESGFLLDFTGQETQDQSIDGWPKDRSRRSVISWQDELKSDPTQLSMSLPMGTSKFSSSTTTKQKLNLSSLTLSPECNPVQMGLAVNTDVTDQTEKQATWISKSLGSSIGGPLGEALNDTASVDNCKNSSTLTLLPEGWDGSTQLGSSPALLSNSPTGSPSIIKS